ncbi:hypothetical protein LGK97_07985 [Clostridium sp. CS001]|uniref:hypothetical protein n=1 Tax=Clostridium sp. CS001 TaxID=2880648 RepID=UPI001CF2BAD6|nr:hypothetical protein [Clostridium sp. CS001]MCB2289702.1 hypothetical protein [Clostridium sp. CS001]
MSKLLRSALSIGTFILLVIAIPYIAIFIFKALFAIAVFGVLVWGGFKLVKGAKNIMYKLSTKKNTRVQADMFSSSPDTSDSIDINYEDSVIIDVDYENLG